MQMCFLRTDIGFSLLSQLAPSQIQNPWADLLSEDQSGEVPEHRSSEGGPGLITGEQHKSYSSSLFLWERL